MMVLEKRNKALNKDNGRGEDKQESTPLTNHEKLPGHKHGAILSEESDFIKEPKNDPE